MLCRFLLLEVEVERLVEGEDGRGWLMAGEGDADGNDDMVNHIIFYDKLINVTYNIKWARIVVNKI